MADYVIENLGPTHTNLLVRGEKEVEKAGRILEKPAIIVKWEKNSNGEMVANVDKIAKEYATVVTKNGIYQDKKKERDVQFQWAYDVIIERVRETKEWKSGQICLYQPTEIKVKNYLAKQTAGIPDEIVIAVLKGKGYNVEGLIPQEPKEVTTTITNE